MDLDEERRPSSAQRMSVSHTRVRELHLMPTVDHKRHLYLDDESKMQLEALFGVLDRTHTGKISSSDYAPVAGSRRSLSLWARLQKQFGGDDAITPERFVSTLKTLALCAPLLPAVFPTVPRSNLECLLRLNVSVNATVKELCRTLYLSACPDAPAPARPVAPSCLWTTHPQLALLTVDALRLDDDCRAQMAALFGALDKMGEGCLSAADFELGHAPQFGGSGLRDARNKWQRLLASFDLTGDGLIHPDEFLVQMEELALHQPLEGFGSLPPSHAECIRTLNRSTNRAALGLGKAIYELTQAS